MHETPTLNALSELLIQAGLPDYLASKVAVEIARKLADELSKLPAVPPPRWTASHWPRR
jgi:hypothetical protein